MMGLGCRHCKVELCDTILYRGSRCRELRADVGQGDPLTNYDRIHGMNPVELSDFLMQTKTVCDWCCEQTQCGGDVPVSVCVDNVRKWLEQEVSNV